MTAEEFLSKLAQSPNETEVNNKMMPGYRAALKPSRETLEQAKKAAVLVHVFDGNKGLEVLFMKRPAYEGTHGGQVSFPGGRVEPSDQSMEQTALREAFEEVGLRQEQLTVVKALAPVYIPPSNFLVSPFVSFAPQLEPLVLQEEEVAYTFSVPLEALLVDELVGTTYVSTKLGKMKVPAYLWKDEVIWGATAIITARLTALLS